MTSDEADPGPRTEAISAVGPPGPLEPAETRPAGWLLGGRYRIHERIGAGGMAEVFRATDELLARDVAVKVFRHHVDPDNSAGGPQRQSVELQALARLSHPNLITLFDGSIGEGGEPAFLVMELVHGPSLAARIAEAPLPPDEAAEIAGQLADALGYVHSQNMVHRDIKPANILLGVDGVSGDAAVRARLSDFGIVRLLGSERLTSVDFMVGTATYLAPEQARGADVGPPADIYALGLVLLEALTGVRAYRGSVLDAVTARLERSPEIPEHFPAPWPGLLQAMTAMEPELRPSAADVGRTLRAGRFAPLPLAGADFAPTAEVAAVDHSGTASVGGLGSAAAIADAALFDAPVGSGQPAFAQGIVPAGSATPVAHQMPATGSSAEWATGWAPEPAPESGTHRRLRGLLAAASVLLAAAVGLEGVLLSRHSSPAPAPATVTAPTAVESPVAPSPTRSPQPIVRSSSAVPSEAPVQTFSASSATAPSSAAPSSAAPSSAAPSSAAPSSAARSSAAPSSTAPTSRPPSSSAPAPVPSASTATRTVTATATAPAASTSPSTSPSGVASTSTPVTTSTSPSVSATTPATSAPPSAAGTPTPVVKADAKR